MRSFLILFIACTACQAQTKQFDADQVSEDISYLQDQLIRFHPGFYRYTDRTQMERYFEKASSAPEGLEGDELYARVTFLLSQVKCGHTRTSMPANIRTKHLADNLFLPFHIKLLGGQPYIAASLSEEIPVGARLTKINGKTYQEIEQIIFDYLPADGQIETGKRRMITRLFPYYYQLYVDSLNGSAEVEWLNEQEEKKTTTMERVSHDELETLPNLSTRITELRLEHFGSYSYMRISTFWQQGLSNAGFNYEDFLRRSFREIKSNGVENLILDLRGNGGGRDNFGALLVSYLLPRPFGYFDNILVTPEYSGYGGVVEKNGKHFVTSHRGLNIWQPQDDVFEEGLYVLTDGGSFSTCADVATVLHHHKRGVFLGEETGGGYDGNTSGNSKAITLPNSGIRISLPMWMYTTANIGHQYPGRGVIPDHRIIPDWSQYAQKEDVVLNKVLEIIGR